MHVRVLHMKLLHHDHVLKYYTFFFRGEYQMVYLLEGVLIVYYFQGKYL